MMISLFPPAADQPEFTALAAVTAEDRTPADQRRPWVLSNMIASADGATAINGLSGDLGGPADFEMFVALRSMADAILVGAKTVVEENYQPPSAGSELAAQGRSQRGQQARPRIVVVTASLSLDPAQRLFSDPDNRPLIATVAGAPADRRAALAEVAEIADFGTERVDLPALISELGAQGHRTILSEGGPSLNGQLIADDLLDEWNLTVSPILASGGSKRPAQGPEPLHPSAPMSLVRVLQADNLLFCRWIRA